MRKLLASLTFAILFAATYAYAEDNAAANAKTSASSATDNAPTGAKEDGAKNGDEEEEESNEPISADNLSGTMDLTSNYVWRGLSQTNNKPAAQGSIDYAFKGLYVDLWGSNVQFNDTTATVEFDATAGFEHEFDSGLGFDVGIIRYMYPSTHFTPEPEAPAVVEEEPIPALVKMKLAQDEEAAVEEEVSVPEDFDYNEGFLLLKYKIFQAGVYYSSDEFHYGVPGTYYTGGINWDIPSEDTLGMEGFNVTATIGRFIFNPLIAPNYTDYLVSLSKALNKTFKVGVAWTDTNGQYNAYPIDKAHWIGTVSAAF